MKIKSYAKVNIYLKIVGVQEGYHLIDSRFMLVKNLYDTIEFKQKDNNEAFTLIGNFSCKKEQNIIYKTYKKLLLIDAVSKKVEDFFKVHSVVVEKNIPEFAGLGGGSSNAGAFLHLTNSTLSLGLSNELMIKISKSLGADVAFFSQGFQSAHVKGVGEIVERFDENALDISVFTPPIKCDTSKVYGKFREILLKDYDKIIKKSKITAKRLQSLKSDEILKNFDIEELNDLFLPATLLYRELLRYKKPGYFFSGSGSSFFKRI